MGGETVNRERPRDYTYYIVFIQIIKQWHCSRKISKRKKNDRSKKKKKRNSHDRDNTEILGEARPLLANVFVEIRLQPKKKKKILARHYNMIIRVANHTVYVRWPVLSLFFRDIRTCVKKNEKVGYRVNIINKYHCIGNGLPAKKRKKNYIKPCQEFDWQLPVSTRYAPCDISIRIWRIIFNAL